MFVLCVNIGAASPGQSDTIFIFQSIHHKIPPVLFLYLLFVEPEPIE